MFKRFLGIDPGRTGAFGLIRPGTAGMPALVRVFDMPGESHRGVDLSHVDDILTHIPADETLVGLEWPTARPGEVPDFAFRFGLQCGQLHAKLHSRFGASAIKLIPPNTWTGKLGLPGKTWHGAMEQRAAVLDAAYPHFSDLIRGPRGGLLDGRIDALLIAHYCFLVSGPLGSKGGRKPPKCFGV